MIPCFDGGCVPHQENEILTEQEELISLEQVLRRQIATEKEEIERLSAEIADIQRYRCTLDHCVFIADKSFNYTCHCFVRSISSLYFVPTRFVA